MLEEMKKYAQLNRVPIICDEGLDFLREQIEKYSIKNVLEIGCAIGYSALYMASLGCEIHTFERNQQMIEQAKKNFEIYDRSHRIKLIEADALQFDQPLNQTFDLIFIDAAKAQYQKFFEKFEHNLSDDGVIICDNLAFHHLDKQKVNRNTRQLINKLEKFITYLKNHPHYKTTFYDVGDGMSITRRKRT